MSAVAAPPTRRTEENGARTDEEKTGEFLALLVQGHTIVYASAEAGIPRRTLYDRKHADEHFAEAWAEALECGIQTLEQEARRRAVEGFERAVTVAGEREVVREFSDTLLIFLLKAKRPNVYRDNARLEVTGAGGGPVQVEHGLDTLGIVTELAEAGLVLPRAHGAIDAASVRRAEPAALPAALPDPEAGGGAGGAPVRRGA